MAVIRRFPTLSTQSGFWIRLDKWVFYGLLPRFESPDGGFCIAIRHGRWDVTVRYRLTFSADTFLHTVNRKSTP